MLASLGLGLWPLSSGRGGPRWRVALVVSLLGFIYGSGQQIDVGWFGSLKINQRERERERGGLILKISDPTEKCKLDQQHCDGLGHSSCL
jgi:hypothetical protein